MRLDEVVLRALEKEPEHRYQHASEVKTGVESVRLNPAAAKVLRTETASIPGAPAGREMDPAAGKPFNEPRLSRCDIVGRDSAPSVLLVVVFPVLTPVGVMAPFGTTILGVVAIGQIRRSAGRLYGLPLAVFDALLFPLLLLDGVILVAVFAVTMTVLVLLGGLGTDGSSRAAPTLGISLPIIAWADYRIARAVCRNATGYQAPPKPSAAVPSTPAVQARERPPRAGQLVMARGRRRNRPHRWSNPSRSLQPMA